MYRLPVTRLTIAPLLYCAQFHSWCSSSHLINVTVGVSMVVALNPIVGYTSSVAQRHLWNHATHIQGLVSWKQRLILWRILLHVWILQQMARPLENPFIPRLIFYWCRCRRKIGSKILSNTFLKTLGHLRSPWQATAVPERNDFGNAITEPNSFSGISVKR